MEKEDIIALFHLIESMKEYAPKMQQALKNKDAEKLAELKEEILAMSNAIGRVLK